MKWYWPKRAFIKHGRKGPADPQYRNATLYISVAAGAIPCIPLCLRVPTALALATAVPFVPLCLSVALVRWGRCRDRRLWRVPVTIAVSCLFCSAKRSVCAACASADTRLSLLQEPPRVWPVRLTSPSKVKMRRASGVCITRIEARQESTHADARCKHIGEAHGSTSVGIVLGGPVGLVTWGE